MEDDHANVDNARSCGGWIGHCRATVGFARACGGYRHHRHGRIAVGQSLAALHRPRQRPLHRREPQGRRGLYPVERIGDPAALGRLAGHHDVHRHCRCNFAPSTRAPRWRFTRFEVQVPPYALLAKAGIKSLKDLKGKVISVGGPKDITRLYVDRMLAPQGLKSTTMTTYMLARPPRVPRRFSAAPSTPQFCAPVQLSG